MIEQLIRTPLTELTGVRHPVVQTGMGWVAGPRLVSGTANAGGLGILASATMSYDELEHAILEVKGRTDEPFGVNLRADAGDAPERVDLLIEHGVKVASFALAPKQELIAKLKDHGIVVMPSVGAARHAEKVAGWGADAVMIQGGEGGGHTGRCRRRCCCRTVLDAVDIPVVAAGGFFDGRGLAAALAYGAAGIGMGTRFLLTQDSSVPEAVKRALPLLRPRRHRRHREGRRHAAPDAAHRPRRGGRERQPPDAGSRPPRAGRWSSRGASGMSWRQVAVDGRAMKKAQRAVLGRRWCWRPTPRRCSSPGWSTGDTDAGVLACGPGRRAARRPARPARSSSTASSPRPPSASPLSRSWRA